MRDCLTNRQDIHSFDLSSEIEKVQGFCLRDKVSDCITNRQMAGER